MSQQVWAFVIAAQRGSLEMLSKALAFIAFTSLISVGANLRLS